jgi:hypothetical protein
MLPLLVPRDAPDPAKWSIVPPNGRLCRQMIDYAAKWSIMPPNGRLCRQMVDYAAKWSRLLDYVASVSC